jgi:hypothetical protein
VVKPWQWLVTCLAVTLLSGTAWSMEAETKIASGTAQDDAYAVKLWGFMAHNRLVGDGRVRSFPFVGSRPHGSIQEVIVTDAAIDGHKGRLIIKHNYGAENQLTPKSVYAADQDENYVALTIMFQREEGYDPGNNNWFWAEYNPDGSVLNYQGTNLSGRSEMCLGCHIPLGGKDREVLNGTSK